MKPADDGTLRFFCLFKAPLILLCTALFAFFMLSTSAGAREFHPDFQVSVKPGKADVAPEMWQTLEREPWFLLHGDQAIKDLSLKLPRRWRVNGESLVEPCSLQALEHGECKQESVAGSAYLELKFLGLITFPVQGKVYYVRSDDYYNDPALGNRPDWVKRFPEGGGAALPVVLAIKLESLGKLPMPPLFLESYLSEDNYRIQADMRVENVLLTAYLARMDLILDGGDPGDHEGLFRTPVTQADACDPQVFNADLASWPDLGWPMFGDPGQEAHLEPELTLTDCVAGSAPFAPRASAVTSSNTAAGQSPKLTVKMERDAGNAYMTGMKVTLPEGMLGSPYATATLCKPEEAERAICPAGSKVAEATMRVNVFEGRETSLSANVYNAPVEGSELARFLAVIEAPPIAKEQVVVLPVLLNLLPDASGITAEISDMPPEFDVRGVELTFDGTTGAGIGHPLLINPSSCDGGKISVEFDSETGQKHTSEVPYTATGCDRQPFDPRVEVSLTCTDPHCAPGLTTTITQNPGEATTKDMRISIPPGFVINDKSSVTPCSAADVNAKTCPDSSGIGTATAISPLTAEPLRGKIYLAEPAEGDTTSLRRIHAELKGLVDISLDGSLVTNESGGFDIVLSGMPEVPLSRVEIATDGGEDKALVFTPFECGLKEITTTATSHSGKAMTSAHDLNVSGPGCGPTLNIRLKPNGAGKHPRLDLIVRPNQGAQPIKTMKFKLGFGLHGLKVRGVRLTRRQSRSISRRCRLRKKGGPRRRCKSRHRSSVTIGSLKLKPTGGKSTTSSLVGRSGRRVRTRTKRRGVLSTRKTKVTLRSNGQLVVRGLPDGPLAEIRVRILGKRRRVLTNPKRKGKVTFRGYFWGTDGTMYVDEATGKVRSAKKNRSRRKP